MDNSVLIAFLLTLFAGLATGIGSAIAFVAKETNKTLLSFSLGLSAGVMIYISFMELLDKAIDDMSVIYGDKMGQFYTILAFFGGILFTMIIDRLVPSYTNPHEIQGVEEMRAGSAKSQADAPELLRVGLLSALVLAIHNFPEGMVTFLAALEDVQLAIPIAFAIAIHNIPEGISVSVPIYYATGSRKKAFWLSFASGLAEPLGAIIAYLFLAPFLTPQLLSILNALIAGIMIYISFDELLPAAEKYGKHHLALGGVITGMLVMALSLVVL